jgi:hypothetical protein
VAGSVAAGVDESFVSEAIERRKHSRKRNSSAHKVIERSSRSALRDGGFRSAPLAPTPVSLGPALGLEMGILGEDSRDLEGAETRAEN